MKAESLLLERSGEGCSKDKPLDLDGLGMGGLNVESLFLEISGGRGLGGALLEGVGVSFGERG